MEAYIWYLAKSTVVSGLFIGFYYLWMRKESFYNLNRFYLLISIVFAYLFPFIRLSFTTSNNTSVEIIRNFQSTINQFSSVNQWQPQLAESHIRLHDYNWMIWVLALVSFVFLFRFVVHLFQIKKLISANEKIIHQKFTLVIFNQRLTFSFFRYIFISQHVWGSAESNCIIDHEISHIRRKHSFDRIFMELLQLAFWMNPFIYLYRKALEEVHEFQADLDVTNKNESITGYFNLVLQQVAHQKYSPLMSPFSYQLIKKRIKMATYKSNPIRRIVILAPLMLAVAIILSSATVQQVQGVLFDIQQTIWPQGNESENILLSDNPDKKNNAYYKELSERNSILSANTITVLMNYQGTILVDGRKTALDNVEEQIVSFYQSSVTKLVKEIPLLGKQQVADLYVFLKKDKNTPDEMADKLIQNVTSGIYEVREEAANKHFKKSLDKCSEEQHEAIVNLIPMHIVVGSHKDMKPHKKVLKSFICPVKEEDLQKISSRYGRKLVHPITKQSKIHKGIDYVAKSGTDILSIGDGTVRKAETSINNKGYGKFIIIDHENGLSSLYAHLKSYNVKEGQLVKRGDVIGFVGNTGMSTAPHLHLEVKRDGKYINPEDVIVGFIDDSGVNY